MQKVLFSTLLGLGLVVLVLAAPGLAQSSDVPALVRIDLMGPDDLARVAALDLPVHAHLTAPGADYLLAVLTPQQQKQLRSLNLALTVLDPDARDAIYYLIESGRPQMAGRVAPAFTIVHDDGRQAVGRLREGVAFQAMDDLSMPVARLSPDPIVLTPRATGLIPTAPFYDPLIAGLLAQINTADVAGYDGGLSGEWPVLVGGEPYALTTRYTYSGEPIAKATQYVYEHMQALGYNVSYHNYTLSYHNLRNVIGEKRGLVHPDQIFLLTAHLDSRAASWPHNPAPGADDNASGSTALMVAADLLAVLDFEYTIRIVFFTGEEQGMWGSYYYARDMAGAEENILGVLNLDMIAWDARYGPDIDLHSHLPSVEDDSDALADLFAAVVDVYNLNLQPQIVENGALFSDHSRFWDRGYAAILAIEDYYNSNEVAAELRDWNTNYHTVNDRLSTLNLEYFREYVRASVATFVHLASPVPTMISGTVTCAETSAPLSATVTAAGQEGVFSGVTDASGTYSILLRPGLYTVTVSAHGYYPQTLTDVAVLTGNDTQVNFALEPLPTFTVSGTVTDAVGGQLLNATVRFDDYAIAAPNGFYSATLPGGAYLVTVSAPFHHPTTRTVAVDRDQRQDFALQPTPCLLVVDDDYDNVGNSHDDQVFYTAALETLGVGYDLWAVPDDADGPPLETLSRYRGVIWLTGRDWDHTLTWADQGALAAYLDGGGRLFLSGQDIGWDIARNGEPPFYRDHLHADYLRDDSGYRELAGADFLSGIAVTIQGGDGADNQKYPSDVGVVGDGAGVFRYPDGDWAATTYADDSYRAVYFAFGFEGINNAADRRAVMQRVLNYLAPCPLPTFTVSGTVTDAVGGQLLSATVRFDDYAIAAPDGFYSATLPGGAYLVTVSAPFHYPTTRTVAVDRDQRQDFALQPTPCLLVVDDDYDNVGNLHDDQVFYTATLETMGVGYDLWAVPDDADGPPLEILSRYQGVIWLTGRDWDRTLTWADQGALAAYLDGGGRLFLSGQDVGWDVARNGEPPFYRDHLHADYLRDDSGYRELTGADFLSGIAVTIEGGDGADNQKYPSDVGVVGDGAGVFRYPDGDWAASAYADDSHRAVYFAFGFEGINNAADRRAVMQRVLNYLAPCSLSTLPYDFALQSTGIRFGERGESVTHTVTIANVGALGDAHNLELSAAAWTTTLPFARSVLLPAQQQIEVSLTVAIPFDAERGDHDQVVLTVTSVYSPVHTAHVVLHTAVGHEVYLPLLLSSGTNTAPDTKP